MGLIEGSTTDVRATIQLTDLPRNYRFILITHGYYDSGFPSYSSAIIPVALLGIIVEAMHFTGGTINGISEKVSVNTFRPTSSEISIAIGDAYLAGTESCYCAVYGIK